MPSRYAPVPTTSQQDEMNAAFDDSDDEEEAGDTQNHDRAPLLTHQAPRSASSSYHPLATEPDAPDSPVDTRPPHAASALTAPPAPGSYNFEFDYPPPPGSPPITAYGNSNGIVPSGPVSAADARPSFLQRALGAIIPSRYVRDAHGGGVGNDGVFANMSARPGGSATTMDPLTGVHFAPEEAQKDAPPSYAAAQMDAVPPYWETTVLAPSTPGADGELVVDGLATGSLFSFMWNLLVSMSFQFVGFLLTYLLHTTHAAKFGSRAGLGVTLIQYGFYLRSRVEYNEIPSNDENIFGWTPPVENKPTFATAEEAANYYAGLGITSPDMMSNSTSMSSMMGNTTSEPLGPPQLVDASAANEWLSFFLMTIGWFVLITAVLGFWRVKRWERGVRQAAQEAANPRPPPTADEVARERAVLSSIEQAFGIVGLVSTQMQSRVRRGAESVRDGLGFPPDWGEGEQREEGGRRDEQRLDDIV